MPPKPRAAGPTGRYEHSQSGPDTVPQGPWRADPTASSRPRDAGDTVPATAPGVLGGEWMGIDSDDIEPTHGAHIDGSDVREIDSSGWSFSALGLSRFPVQEAQRWPLEFVAAGREFLRMAALNALLLLVTLGLYYPWARASRLQFIYTHTLVVGQPLAFDGRPRQIAGGMAALLLAACGLALVAYHLTWGGLVAACGTALVLPAVYHARLRFVLRHTTWQRLRIGFGGSLRGAYGALLPPLLLALLPLGLLRLLPGLSEVAPDGASGTSLSPTVAYPLYAGDLLLGLAGLMWVALMLGAPYFWWRLARYRQGHLKLGPLQTEFRCTPGHAYRVLVPVCAALLVWGAALLAGAHWALEQWPNSDAALHTPDEPWLPVPLLAALWVVGLSLLGAAARAYARARVQNLAWSCTGNRYLRFRSSLATGPYVLLCVRNRLLSLLTCGGYTAWAAVEARRMRTAAISVVSRLVPDEIVAVVRARQAQSDAGAADELLGLRFGW